MDTSASRFAKPTPTKRKRTRITKDGRLIESAGQYRKTKAQMWTNQFGYCAKENCPNYMATPQDGHRHHPGGRGMGGSKRDDRKTVLWCTPCHIEEHQ